MLAVHLENLLFLLLLVVAGLFQLLGSAARKASTDETKRTSESPPRMSKPIPRAPKESDEERVRKFLEALGQPSASQPPPVANRPTYRKPFLLPRVQPLGSPLPPLVIRPPDLPQEIQIPVASPSAQPQQTHQPVGEVMFAVHETGAPLEPISGLNRATVDRTQPQIAASARNIDVAALLRSPRGLRGAVIVREILGPPRALGMRMELSEGIS
jgi:hypothetical protein